MKVEEQVALVNDLMANHTDQAKVSTILATLTEDYAHVSAELANTQTVAQQAEAEKEQLRKANMALFLKLPQGKAEDTTHKETETQSPKFENLFDKDGNLL